MRYLVVVSVFLLLAGCQRSEPAPSVPSIPATIQVQKIEIVDSAGNVVIELGAVDNKDEPYLHVLDANGKRVATIGDAGEAGYVQLAGPGGAWLGITTVNGRARVALVSAGGKKAAVEPR